MSWGNHKSILLLIKDSVIYTTVTFLDYIYTYTKSKCNDWKRMFVDAEERIWMAQSEATWNFDKIVEIIR